MSSSFAFAEEEKKLSATVNLVTFIQLHHLQTLPTVLSTCICTSHPVKDHFRRRGPP